MFLHRIRIYKIIMTHYLFIAGSLMPPAPPAPPS